jgi:tetratricopeptide (TPR) repeat protein
VEDSEILEEVPTILGVVLWRTLRTVRLWTETPPASRAGLFPAHAHETRLADLLTCECPPAIDEALHGLAGLLARPREADPVRVAAHCMTIADWGRAGSHPRVTLAYLQAAAHACPRDPALALQAGREARGQAFYPLAETWLNRAVVVSRQQGAWETYTRAQIAIGNMLIRRGALPAARRPLLRAARRAHRAGLREVRGMALHDLFVLTASTGPRAEALQYAQGALVSYPRATPKVVALAFDMAAYWMLEGYFEEALATYRAVRPRIEARAIPNVNGAIARAAGALGREAEYDAAVRALEGCARPGENASAWVFAAYGAVNLARWDAARAHAQRGLDTAAARQEHQVAFEAEALLRQIEERSRPALPVVEREPAVWELASDVVATLEAIPAGSAA